MRIGGFDHFVLTVADIDATVMFYTQALGMTAEVFQPGDGSTRTALTFAGHKINLHRAGREFTPKAAIPTPGAGDFCLLTTTPLDEWQDHLRRLGIEIEEGPVARTGARGAIESIYLRDPDRNLVEIARYT